MNLGHEEGLGWLDTDELVPIVQRSGPGAQGQAIRLSSSLALRRPDPPCITFATIDELASSIFSISREWNSAVCDNCSIAA